MKKIYYNILILIMPFLVNAQTITQADLPTAGIAFTMGNDTTYAGSISPGGTGQTWNFPLQNHYTDTTGFIAAAGTPYVASFPTSNIAAHDPTDGTYAYYTNNSNGFYIDGFVTPGGMLQYYQPLQFIPVPFSYGNTHNNTGRAQIDTAITDTSGTTNYRIVFRTESFFIADASGTLTTPTGTYPNVLRIKITEAIYDSVYFDIGGGFYIPSPIGNSVSYSTTYRFVTSGLQVNYLLGMDADSAGTTAAGAQFLIASINLNVPVVPEIKSLSTYPNPAISTINFKNLNSEAEIVIYDGNGKEVYRESSFAGKSINVESLRNGVYHYEVIHEGKSEKGSVVIQH